MMGGSEPWKSANTAMPGSSPPLPLLRTGLPALPAQFLHKSLETIIIRIYGKGSAHCLEFKKFLIKSYLPLLLCLLLLLSTISYNNVILAHWT